VWEYHPVFDDSSDLTESLLVSDQTLLLVRKLMIQGSVATGTALEDVAWGRWGKEVVVEAIAKTRG
jgi:hypothetical protein